MTNWIRIHGNILGVLYGILSYFVITQRWYIALGIGIGLGIYTNYFVSYIMKIINMKIGEMAGSAVGQIFFKRK